MVARSGGDAASQVDASWLTLAAALELMGYWYRIASAGEILPACHAGSSAPRNEARRAIPTIRHSSSHGTLKVSPVLNCSKKFVAKILPERISPSTTPSILPSMPTKNDSHRNAT